MFIAEIYVSFQQQSFLRESSRTANTLIHIALYLQHSAYSLEKFLIISITPCELAHVSMVRINWYLVFPSNFQQRRLLLNNLE